MSFSEAFRLKINYSAATCLSNSPETLRPEPSCWISSIANAIMCNLLISRDAIDGKESHAYLPGRALNIQ
jgi:hypothetical protein